MRNEAEKRVIRDALGIGIATGTYGLSFGALSTTAGLTLPQTCVLSLLMFTGASQFAFVGVVAAGGAPLAGAATAALLGSRNALYGLHLARLHRLRLPRRLGAAQFVIDESAAMSLDTRNEPLARLGFWAAGLSVFGCWNIATLLGALGARALSNPSVLGLDVVAPAAFVALMAPRLRTPITWWAALIAAAVALTAVPFTPAGVPVLLAAAAVVALSLWSSHDDERRVETDSGEVPRNASHVDDTVPEERKVG
ncbi:putative branched-subunit amino acid permease [Streptomyces sp. Ag109_O5-1]|uniref:AzlC family ABC transporter permease n=1 Tax=Streptomyces sp. Ag109_O5-1 TaxID=1938851 RepID=UPI000F4E0DA7|nr:AzlC family ABC transporter permease [Streptomyces sp. Ag109_O5-1]RPE47188.1 putative branched-subunit amino acid permease [Streptomyces sp. Ag109_O5-1]